MPSRQFIFPILFLMLFFHPEKAKGQWNNESSTIDTSEYLPFYYENWLHYNLMIAAARGYSTEIERMLDMGADVNASTFEGATPLVFAVANNKPEAVRTILSFNPEIDVVTSAYETPLMIAVKNNSFEIAEMLIRAGANIDTGDLYGATSLHYAALYGYLDLTDLLLYYDAQTGLRTIEGTTPLLTAVWAGHHPVADLLLQNNASPEEADNDGFTPFLLSSYFGDTLMMDILSKHGADIYKKTNSGYNALSLAIMSGDNEAAEYLLNIGNNWDKTDGNASDPYTIAAKYGRKDIVNMLQEKNIPGRIKYSIDQMSLMLTSRFAIHDFSPGISVEFREPLSNLGFAAGLDTKPWHTRVLIRENDTRFYQYMDKGSLVYAGLFKDFQIAERPGKYNFMLSGSLLAGYSFGNKLKGTYYAPEARFRIIPSAAIKIRMNQLQIITAIEYMRTEFHKVGPIWFRIGAGYNYYFDNLRTRIKPPKWF